MKGSAKFIVAYITFFMFIFFVVGLGAPSIMSEDQLNQSQLTPPDCNISGWDAPFDAGMCGFESMGFFFTLLTIESSIGWFTRLILIPFFAGLVYVIVELLMW